MYSLTSPLNTRPSNGSSLKTDSMYSMKPTSSSRSSHSNGSSSSLSEKKMYSHMNAPLQTLGEFSTVLQDKYKPKITPKEESHLFEIGASSLDKLYALSRRDKQKLKAITMKSGLRIDLCELSSPSASIFCGKTYLKASLWEFYRLFSYGFAPTTSSASLMGRSSVCSENSSRYSTSNRSSTSSSSNFSNSSKHLKSQSRRFRSQMKELFGTVYLDGITIHNKQGECLNPYTNCSLNWMNLRSAKVQDPLVDYVVLQYMDFVPKDPACLTNGTSSSFSLVGAEDEIQYAGYLWESVELPHCKPLDAVHHIQRKSMHHTGFLLFPKGMDQIAVEFYWTERHKTASKSHRMDKNDKQFLLQNICYFLQNVRDILIHQRIGSVPLLLEKHMKFPEQSTCQICQTLFKRLTNRRRNCRMCGKSICKKCLVVKTITLSKQNVTKLDSKEFQVNMKTEVLICTDCCERPTVLQRLSTCRENETTVASAGNVTSSAGDITSTLSESIAQGNDQKTRRPTAPMGNAVNCNTVVNDNKLNVRSCLVRRPSYPSESAIENNCVSASPEKNKPTNPNLVKGNEGLNEAKTKKKVRIYDTQRSYMVAKEEAMPVLPVQGTYLRPNRCPAVMSPPVVPDVLVSAPDAPDAPDAPVVAPDVPDASLNGRNPPSPRRDPLRFTEFNPDCDHDEGDDLEEHSDQEIMELIDHSDDSEEMDIYEKEDAALMENYTIPTSDEKRQQFQTQNPSSFSTLNDDDSVELTDLQKEKGTEENLELELELEEEESQESVVLFAQVEGNDEALAEKVQDLEKAQIQALEKEQQAKYDELTQESPAEFDVSPIPPPAPSNTALIQANTSFTYELTYFPNQAWPSVPYPPNELERLPKVKELLASFGKSSDMLDLMMEQVGVYFNCSMVYVTLMESNTAIIISQRGIPNEELPRNICLDAHTIMSEAPTIILDARKDTRFQYNPLVGSGRFRFYLGIPLRSKEGYHVGALSLGDGTARENITTQSIEMLHELGDIIMKQLENKAEKSGKEGGAGLPGQQESTDLENQSQRIRKLAEGHRLMQRLLNKSYPTQ